MTYTNDPIGFAVQDFVKNGSSENILVQSDLCDDDIMPVAYLFRPHELMPELEQIALAKCKGRILDVGAAAGCHTVVLDALGQDVTALDFSPGCAAYLKSLGLKTIQGDFYAVTEKYDTLLILMNGIGIAQNLANLPAFLTQLKKCLNVGGSALCDSTDLSYLYQEDDGSMWVDLNSPYHGEMNFQMTYKDVVGEWFKWIYIDFDLLSSFCEEQGLACEKIYQGENDHYLVEIKVVE